MGRNYSKRSSKDVESASETLINSELGSSILKRKNEAAPIMPVTASLDSSPVFDDFSDKRTKRCSS